MASNVAGGARLPVDWWAPSIAGVGIVSFAALVVGTLLIGGGEFAGFMWMALVAVLFIYAIVTAFSVLLIDLVVAATRDGELPTGTLAFASAAGATLVPLLVAALAWPGKNVSFGTVAVVLIASPLVWRLLVSRRQS